MLLDQWYKWATVRLLKPYTSKAVVMWSSKMDSTRIWILASMYVRALGDIQSGTFKLIEKNYQFGQHGTITEIAVTSVMRCAAECERVNCRSFSLSESKLCTLSHLHVQEKIPVSSLIFVIEQGTKIFSVAGKYLLCFWCLKKATCSTFKQDLKRSYKSRFNAAWTFLNVK